MFPCIVEILKDKVFNNKHPILVGMHVLDGIMRVGTPLCVPDKENLRIGKVTSIMLNGKPLNEAWVSTGDVSVKIEGETTIQVGWSFDENMKICS